MQRGDRVRLTDHGVRVQSASYHRRNRVKLVDWAARRGTIKMVGKIYVYVLWDGRRSADCLLPVIIELA